MEHIKIFLNRMKIQMQKPQHPGTENTLTETGARLMALGSTRSYRKIRYDMRPHLS